MENRSKKSRYTRQIWIRLRNRQKATNTGDKRLVRKTHFTSSRLPFISLSTYDMHVY